MGVPKESLMLPTGQTMFDTVVATLGSVCVQVMVVGAVHEHLRHIPDLRLNAGPLGGLEALLASGLDKEYLVCPADIPLATPALLRRLTENEGSVATIFEVEGHDRLQSLPIRISDRALGKVSAALDKGQNAIHRLLVDLDVVRVTLTAGEARALTNINTPEEFTALGK